MQCGPRVVITMMWRISCAWLTHWRGDDTLTHPIFTITHRHLTERNCLHSFISLCSYSSPFSLWPFNSWHFFLLSISVSKYFWAMHKLPQKKRIKENWERKGKAGGGGEKVKWGTEKNRKAKRVKRGKLNKKERRFWPSSASPPPSTSAKHIQPIQPTVNRPFPPTPRTHVFTPSNTPRNVWSPLHFLFWRLQISRHQHTWVH